MAKAMGRRGGLARARRLSADHRKKIASLGGKARRISYQAAHRIEANFRYLEAVSHLAKQAKVTVKHRVTHPLPNSHESHSQLS